MFFKLFTLMKDLIIKLTLCLIIAFLIFYYEIRLQSIRISIREETKRDMLIEMTSERNRAMKFEDSIYLKKSNSIIKR